MAISYDERERMPIVEREKYQIERLRWICEYAYKNAPAYKGRFDQAGVDPSQIRSLKDLEKIPVLTRDEFIKLQREDPPFGGFLTVPPESLKRIYVHPGPQYEPHDEADLDRLEYILQQVGVKKGDIVINTTAYHLVPTGLIVDEVLARHGLTVIPSGPGNTDLQVQIMHDLKVTFFAGFPLFLMTIIKRAEELGYDFRRDFALRGTIALGGPSLRESFEKDYGLETREGYGFLPIGVPAYECEQRSGMHFVEDFIVEVIDPATGKQLGPGEIGEVVVTNLFSKVMPKIRFGSGDLSYYTDEPCPCGRTSNRLPRIVGRVGEAVKIKGMFLHPREVEDVLSHFPEISRFQAVASHERIRGRLKDVLTGRIELADEAIDRQRLVESFQKEFQSRCRLRIDKVEFVPQGTIPADAKKVEDQREEIIL